MTLNRILFATVALLLSLSFACRTTTLPEGVQPGPATNASRGQNPQVNAQPQDAPAALPDKAFKAEISLRAPPAKLRAGQKETVRVKIRNASDVMWWSRGGRVNTRPDNKFYLAVGNRWLKADGSLLTNMDGRYGLPQNLAPGAEAEVPLQITAPTQPGEYTLEVDVLQEQVGWFSDKGSTTAKTKITVVQ